MEASLKLGFPRVFNSQLVYTEPGAIRQLQFKIFLPILAAVKDFGSASCGSLYPLVCCSSFQDSNFSCDPNSLTDLGRVVDFHLVQLIYCHKDRSDNFQKF